MQRRYGLAVMVICGFVFMAGQASAWHRTGSGGYTSRLGSGRYQRDVQGGGGERRAVTTWQNSRGQQGQVDGHSDWDPAAGKGTYQKQTTLPSGQTVTRHGTVTRNTDGSFTQKGTITGPNGHTVDVDRTVTKNAGGHDTHTTYTNAQGKTLTVDKDVQHDNGVRSANGTYQTSGGKSGEFHS